MHARLHHIENTLERCIHELEREDKAAGEEQDGAFGARKREIPSEKGDAERDGQLEMEIALLTESVEYASHRVAEAAKEFMHGFLCLTAALAASLSLGSEHIGNHILDLEHPLFMVETGQMENTV